MEPETKANALEEWMAMYEEIQIYLRTKCLSTMDRTNKTLQGIEDCFRNGVDLVKSQKDTINRLQKQIEHRREELLECLKAQDIFIEKYPPYQWKKLTSKEKDRYLSFLNKLKWRHREGDFVFAMLNRIKNDEEVSTRMISILETMMAERSAH